MVAVILLENGEALLQETGDFILLEFQPPETIIISKIFRLGITPFNGTLVKHDKVIKLRLS